jgi:hypothetical protein
MTKFIEVVALLVLYTTVCLYIMSEALTRGNAIIRGKHSYGWGVMYGLAFFFACGELIDAWYFMSWDSTYAYELSGLVAFGFNLYLTRGLWREGPPKNIEVERRKIQIQRSGYYNERRNKTSQRA